MQSDEGKPQERSQPRPTVGNGEAEEEDNFINISANVTKDDWDIADILLVVDFQIHHGNTTWQQKRQCQQKRLRENNLHENNEITVAMAYSSLQFH